ncbi:MAG: chemotaxis protein CheW [Bacteroidota bacterium]|jgi:purine-binding chemotaxis protein CheW|nr:chemotaxis protein CheW [Bacteroidota bacterium]MDP4190218.1 chemotaxis protein CheW [Bacteroidota bacterium]MDP4195523.1 chemotaxis protein CheW [Bacteroidota bacterium]
MATAAITETRQYLTFKLNEEVFGVDVVQVREILDYIKITKVPQTPDFMCGVINLRGSVVPVIDMRLKFGMLKTEITVNTCIVVMEVNMDGETFILGALVDSVQEVFELEPNDIEPAPKIGTRLNTEFIKGMGKKEEKFIIILDIDKVFSSIEIESITTGSKEVEEKS